MPPLVSVCPVVTLAPDVTLAQGSVLGLVHYDPDLLKLGTAVACTDELGCDDSMVSANILARSTTKLSRERSSSTVATVRAGAQSLNLSLKLLDELVLYLGFFLSELLLLGLL